LARPSTSIVLSMNPIRQPAMSIDAGEEFPAALRSKRMYFKLGYRFALLG
jgi:hypothetical protein